MQKEILEREELFFASNTLDANLKEKGITARERQIISLVVAGFSNKEIALRLRISFRTVEAHRSTIKHKTGVSNIFELARIRENIS
jgi:DNA-binding NarL/FixJ family response regulator